MGSFDGGAVLGGAGTGAQIGGKFGGPWGAAIGAIVGGIAGGIGSSKAKRRRKKAEELRKRMMFNSAMTQRFAAIRQGFANQALIGLSVQASGATGASSAYQGAMAGAQNSLAQSLKYNALNFRATNRIAQLTAKASRDENLLQGGMSALGDVVGSMGSWKAPKENPSVVVGSGKEVPTALPKYNRGDFNLEPSIKFPSQG